MRAAIFFQGQRNRDKGTCTKKGKQKLGQRDRDSETGQGQRDRTEEQGQ